MGHLGGLSAVLRPTRWPCTCGVPPLSLVHARGKLERHCFVFSCQEVGTKLELVHERFGMLYEPPYTCLAGRQTRSVRLACPALDAGVV